MKPKPLYVLAVFFAVSFAGRVIALAEELDIEAIGQNKTNNQHVDADSALASHKADTCITGDLAESVTNRISELNAREKTIKNRETELHAYEAQIEKRLTQLEAANGKFSTQVDEVRALEEANIARVASIYEGMKPAQASLIFEKMDPKFAAGLLSSLSSEKAAQIVASMDTEKAYLVSVIMANRKSS